MQRKENRTLFLLKGISCIIILLYHCPIPGLVGSAIIYGLRFPIPVFFLITGYYCREETCLKKAGKTLVLLVQAEAIAALALLAGSLIQGRSVFALQVTQPWDVIRILLSGGVFNGTLWYLYATVWSYIIFWLFRKINGMKALYAAAIPLLLLNVSGRVYVTVNYDINEYVFLFRSTLLFAVPFVAIGHFIRKHENDILRRLTNPRIALIILFGLCLIVVEYLCWRKFMDFHISTFFVAVGLFLFGIKNPEMRHFGLFTQVGKYLSKYVYILHVPVIILAEAIWHDTAFLDTVFFPMLVLGVTLTVSCGYVLLKSAILKKPASSR